MMDFYPLEDCDVRRRILLLLTKIVKRVRRIRLTIQVLTMMKMTVIKADLNKPSRLASNFPNLVVNLKSQRIEC